MKNEIPLKRKLQVFAGYKCGVIRLGERKRANEWWNEIIRS